MEMTKEQLIAEMMMVAMETHLPEQLVTAMSSLETELPDDKSMRDYIRGQVRLRLDGNSKDALQHMAPASEDKPEHDADEEYAMHLAKALKDAGADEDEIEYMMAFKGSFKGKSKGKGKGVACHWCGKLGHLKRECGALDKYMAWVRGEGPAPGGKEGEKGKGKGEWQHAKAVSYTHLTLPTILLV